MEETNEGRSGEQPDKSTLGVMTVPAQVNQLHNECLTALFRESYYKRLHSNTVGYAKIFDFSIALGSAASGGTGLGILADPRFGWLCGIATTFSVLLSVAKGVWGWDAKTKFALERVQFYSDLGTQYMALVDDLNAASAWNRDFEERRKALRSRSNPATPDPYSELSKKVQDQIQASVRQSVPFTTMVGMAMRAIKRPIPDPAPNPVREDPRPPRPW
jgi:hypothetical protein